MRRLALLLFLVGSRGALATEYVIDARDVFRAQLIDGGLINYSTMLGPVPIPGTDQGLVNGSDIGYDSSSSRFAIIQLAGPDAGQILRDLPGDRFAFARFAFRAQTGTEPPRIWFWSPYGYVGRIDADRVSVWKNNWIEYGDWPTLAPSGGFRVTTDNFTNAIGWSGIVVHTDGGFSEVELGTSDNSVMAVSPTGTNRYYGVGFPASDGTRHLRTGFMVDGTGSTDIGVIPGYVSLYPSDATAAFHAGERTYLVLAATDAGAYDVHELSPTGYAYKGAIVPRIDGGFCRDFGCSFSSSLYAAQEAFPGYPGGALVITNHGTPDNTARSNVLLVPWDEVATALGLDIDAGPLPVAHINDVSELQGNGGGGGGGGGGGNGGGVFGTIGAPRSPGIPVSSTSASCASAGQLSSSLLLAVLGVLAFSVLLRRTRRP